MKYLTILWKWSWLFTFPVACIYVYWGVETIDRYYTFEVRHPHYSESGSFKLLDVGAMEFNHFLRSSYLSLLSLDSPAQNSKLETVNLFISDSDITKLNSHLPHSGESYVEGGILNNNKINKVMLRYRGDSVYHWGYYKKSFRVKTRKKTLYKGMRKFNLIAPRSPEILNNYLSYRLGKKLGLISPYVEMVNLVVNGSYMGVYVLTEQLDESTLRSNGVMPGDLYSGELVLQDSYSGIINDLFNNPRLWKKIATNNHYEEGSMRPIEELTASLQNKQSMEIQDSLESLLDIDSFAKFNALEILTGTSHVDDVHNWRLYYDPMRSYFVPVVWDLVGWLGGGELSDGSPRVDVITSGLHSALHKNGNYLRARQKAINEFFVSGRDVEFLNETSEIINEIKLNIVRDPNVSANVKSLNDKDVNRSLDDLNSRIRKAFSWAKKIYSTGSIEDEVVFSSDSINSYSISLLGQRPIRSIKFNFANDISSNNKNIKANLIYWMNDKKVKKDVTDYLIKNNSSLDLNVSLIQASSQKTVSAFLGDVYSNRLENSEGYYEIQFSGINEGGSLVEMLVDRGDGDYKSVKRLANLVKKSFYNLYGVVKVPQVDHTEVWSGNVRINKNTVIKNNLFIRPGTIVSFETGTSLIVYGRMIAEGDLNNPIKFIGAQKNQEPWGSVVLKGRLANSSRLSNCEFSGGSGFKGDLFEYTAMLSIHDVKDVVVNKCIFSDSKITDDMVHVVYSKVRFTDSRFERSLMDALDIDISDAVVERCHFIDSGNDSIDLMTSNAVVIDTLIENSGDKAASVGEASHLLAINNVLRNNMVGVQAKDGSIASLYNTELIGNNSALHAYKKNWRYINGGTIFVYKGLVDMNDKLLTAEKKSKIFVFDSYIDKSVDEMNKRIKFDSIVDNENYRKARSNVINRHKYEVKAMMGFDSRYWDLVHADRRGALGVVSH